MKKLIALLAGLAIAGTAFAQVDPTRPMVTGRGNVDAHPAPVIVTNQTKQNSGETLTLEKFQVTGSLLRPAAKPGRGTQVSPAPTGRTPAQGKATTASPQNKHAAA